MIRTTAKVSGMVCGMCEAHVNDAIRDAFPVKRVVSSRARGETVIESESPIDVDQLRKVVNATGYMTLSVITEEIPQREQRQSFFRRLIRGK